MSTQRWNMYATDRKKVHDVAENTDSVMVLGVVV